MGQYVVKLEGGGEMRVNANSQAAAEDNVRSTGNTPAGSGGGGSSGGGGGGDGVRSDMPVGETYYMTINGPKTVSQMNNELYAAGWGGPAGEGTSGPGATANAYAR